MSSLRPHDSSVSTKEYTEALITRLETTVKDQIASLRQDIERMQANYVTRNEHEIMIAHLREDILLLRTLFHDQMRDLRETTHRDRQKLIAIVGIVAATAVGGIQALLDVLR